MFKIGELSKILDVSVQAIRHYHKLGLIHPANVDETTGYRYFDDTALDAIWRIKVLQSSGFTLNEIRGMKSIELIETESIFREKQLELDREIRRKQLALSYLEKHIHEMNLKRTDPEYYQGKYRTIPMRYGQSIPISESGTIADHIHELSRVKSRYGLHQEVAFQPARLIDIINSKPILRELFAVAEWDDAKNIKEMSQCKEALYYCQKWAVRKHAIDEIYSAMIQVINQDGYALRGDAIELILIDDNLTEHEEHYIKEIQIAVIEK